MYKDRTVEVAIPIYKALLDEDEIFSVDRTFAVLGAHPIIFFAPAGLPLDFYTSRYPTAKYLMFPPEYFVSTQAYSRLLMRADFYEAFRERDFILIVQPDVYLFRDDLHQWLQSPFDYVGAPWPQGFTCNFKMEKFLAFPEGKAVTAYVGNGGFSLRRISKCIQLIEENKEIADWFVSTESDEDLFFSFIGTLTAGFLIPNQVQASLFSMELDPQHLYILNGKKLPMGVHAFRRHMPEFWVQHIPR